MVFVKRTLGIKTEEPKKTPARHSADAKLGKGGKKGKGGGKSGGHKSKGGGKGGRRAAAEDISVTASAPNGMVRATATHKRTAPPCTFPSFGAPLISGAPCVAQVQTKDVSLTDCFECDDVTDLTLMLCERFPATFREVRAPGRPK